jgi:hypothetical protein
MKIRSALSALTLTAAVADLFLTAVGNSAHAQETAPAEKPAAPAGQPAAATAAPAKATPANAEQLRKLRSRRHFLTTAPVWQGKLNDVMRTITNREAQWKAMAASAANDEERKKARGEAAGMHTQVDTLCRGLDKLSAEGRAAFDKWEAVQWRDYPLPAGFTDSEAPDPAPGTGAPAPVPASRPATPAAPAAPPSR